jgi:hypothetical protein
VERLLTVKDLSEIINFAKMFGSVEKKLTTGKRQNTERAEQLIGSIYNVKKEEMEEMKKMLALP